SASLCEVCADDYPVGDRLDELQKRHDGLEQPALAAVFIRRDAGHAASLGPLRVAIERRSGGRICRQQSGRGPLPRLCHVVLRVAPMNKHANDRMMAALKSELSILTGGMGKLGLPVLPEACHG